VPPEQAAWQTMSGRNTVRHFEVLRKTKKTIGTEGVICLADNVYPVIKEKYYVPAWLI